jgi:spoIIIJ-associated protein
MSDTTPNAQQQAALEIIEDILGGAGLDLAAKFAGNDEGVTRVEIVGVHGRAAFGDQGKALDALQFLVNQIVGRKVSREIRVMLDCDGYRQRRSETLIAEATAFAQQVIEMQQECELDPLPPHERRIIHNALQQIEGIRTFSEGEEPDRRLVIAPA